MNWNKELPLTQSLAWIVFSMFVVTGGAYTWIQQAYHSKRTMHYEPVVSSIIQTGPQKQPLTTEYLAELLGLSSDRPLPVKKLNIQQVQKALLRSPLIKQAEVKLLKPGTLYIDYVVRQPVAWLEDYENVAIDKEGYPFPFAPFFSPKNLPSFYLGLSAFGVGEEDSQKPQVQWLRPVEGKLMELSLSILSCVSDLKVCDQFLIERIDVSNAFSPSYGKREVVIITEDVFTQHIQGKDIEFHQPRLLRLSVKNFAQELGNYLKLRRQLLEEEQKVLSTTAFTQTLVQLPEKVLDFRIDHLAFVQD